MQSKEMLEMIKKHIEDGNYTVDSVEFGEVEVRPGSVTAHDSLDGPIAEEITTDEYQEIKIIVKRSRFEVRSESQVE